MFDSEADVFANLPAEHRPDVSAPARAAAVEARTPAAPRQPPIMPQMGASPDGLGAELAFLEPPDTSVEAAVRSAGFTTLLAAVAGGAGLAIGGAWGGVSGLTLTGAVSNIYRAQKWWGSPSPSQKHEAVVSGVVGALDLAVGLYTGYKAWQARGDD